MTREERIVSPRLLAVVNTAGRGLGRFEPWLAASGITMHIVDGVSGLPNTLDGYHGLILLGGGFMPTDDEIAGWLPDERRLAEEAIATGIPTLGICLGAQIIAHVAGGTVEADSGTPERGSTPLTQTDAGARDALFADVPPSFTAIENHRDAITALPPGAVLLASSAHCVNQAFRLGDHIWGVQFHPEVGADVTARWSVEDAAADGFDHATLVRTADTNEDDSARVCRLLADGFAASILHTHRQTNVESSRDDSPTI